jgi:hypothetical protein
MFFFILTIINKINIASFLFFSFFYLMENLIREEKFLFCLIKKKKNLIFL